MVIDLAWHVVPGFQFGGLGGEAQEDETEESLRTAIIEIRFGELRCWRRLLDGDPETFVQRGVGRPFSDGAIQCIRAMMLLGAPGGEPVLSAGVD